MEEYMVRPRVKRGDVRGGWGCSDEAADERRFLPFFFSSAELGLVDCFSIQD
jgi:hypothetical protein